MGGIQAPQTLTRLDPSRLQVSGPSRGVLFAAGAYDGPTWYRVETPARWLERQGYPIRVAYFEISEARGDFAPVAGEPIGAVVSQRGCGLSLLLAAAALQRAGLRFIYDLDDDVWSVPRWNGLWQAFGDAERKTVTSLVRIADRVTVSTEALGDVVELFNWRVQVIPNALPPDAVEEPRPRRRPGFRIGWAGSPTHDRDLEQAEGALAALLEKHEEIRLVFMGWCPPVWAGHPRVELHEWVQPPRYYQALADLELDVFVAPLCGHPFNRSKSDVKLLEAGCMGWPIVCTDFGPYRDGPQAVPALRVAVDAPQQWYEALAALIADPTRRRELGEAARRHVLGSRMIDHTGPKWARALGLEAET